MTALAGIVVRNGIVLLEFIEDARREGAELEEAVIGYEATSVDEIARQSGIVKASFCKYFKSKEELLQGTIAFVQEDMEKELEKVYLNSRLSPREAFYGGTRKTMEQMAAGYVDYAAYVQHNRQA